MSFKKYYLSLPVNERESLAQQAGTTRGTLNQIVYAGKEIELGLADCLVALCDGLSLDDMPLTERAKQQHAVRSGTATPEPLIQTSELVMVAPVAGQTFKRSNGEVVTDQRKRDIPVVEVAGLTVQERRGAAKAGA